MGADVHSDCQEQEEDGDSDGMKAERVVVVEVN